MPPPSEAPGRIEATALAIAGPAFAASLFFLRKATPFGAGVFDGAAVACVAIGLAPWVHRAWGAFYATLVRGAGLVGATLLMSSALVAPFFSAVAPTAAAIAGGTILQANARRATPSLAIEGFGAAALAGAFALAFLISPSFPEPDRLRTALFLAAAATIVGLALRRFAIARGWGDLAPMPLGILLVSILGGVYLAYRKLVQDHVANLPLYEWTLAAGAAGLLLARLRRTAKAREVPDAWSGEARRHAQDVRPVYDARMAPLAAAVGRWLERGEAFDEYRAVMQAHGHQVPDSISALGRSAGLGRTKGARAREAAAQRLTAHTSLMRGPTHGAGK